MEGSVVGVRKGAWTEEEDILLKKCIEKYGEGKWNLVPSRAGLNRCRMSCRLRWLNYLKPDIKRGDFAADEVDLIIRLHNLLGNRWSLIAGRIPGRTANDVKNYWNTHLVKKLNPSSNKYLKPEADLKINSSKPNTNVFKPRPRSLSSMNSFRRTILDGNNDNSTKNAGAVTATTSSLADSFSNNEEMIWWENFLMNENEDDDQLQYCSFNNSNRGDTAFNEEIMGNRARSNMVEEGDYEGWDDLLSDAEPWNVFNPEPENPV